MSRLLLTAGLLAMLAGCSKPPTSAAITEPTIVNLGVLDVANGVPTRHDLGNGHVCIVMPIIQKDGRVLLSLRIKDADSLLAVLRIQTLSDQQAEVVVDNVGVALTPHVKPGAISQTNPAPGGLHLQMSPPTAQQADDARPQ